MVRKKQMSLKEIVGDKVYSVWVDMLRRLVPEGRTERLAPMIASMLVYAVEIAREEHGDFPEEGTLAYELLSAAQGDEPEENEAVIIMFVKRLFGDAKVPWKRTNSKGYEYTVSGPVVSEFFRWFNMPWED